jgi:hypothetical protein
MHTFNHNNKPSTDGHELGHFMYLADGYKYICFAGNNWTA